jgi:hypothetical protein
MDKEIAVRFYENKRYGSTYAKGQFHKAVFNATADLQQPRAKYLLDMLCYKDWVNTARSDADMQLVQTAQDLLRGHSGQDVLATFVKRLDTDGSKPRVNGLALLDLNTNQLTLVIEDEAMSVAEAWQLEAKPCKAAQQNKNSPQLLATNVDLH